MLVCACLQDTTAQLVVKTGMDGAPFAAAVWVDAHEKTFQVDRTESSVKSNGCTRRLALQVKVQALRSSAYEAVRVASNVFMNFAVFDAFDGRKRRSCGPTLWRGDQLGH